MRMQAENVPVEYLLNLLDKLAMSNAIKKMPEIRWGLNRKPVNLITINLK